VAARWLCAALAARWLCAALAVFDEFNAWGDIGGG